MSIDIERAIAIGEHALRAIDLVVTAVKTATTSLEAAKAQLAGSLDELKKMRSKREADHAAEDTALDAKFRGDE